MFWARRPGISRFPIPEPAEGEALIQVRAAGLHPVVKAMASGAHYSARGEVPAVAGLDGVGVLEDGSRVYFGFVRKPWGTMAELAAAPRSKCIPLPDGMSDAEAAAIANPGMSAWVSLKERAGLVAGETVLVHGRNGRGRTACPSGGAALGAKRVIAAGRNVDAIAAADVDAIIALGQPEEAVREALAAEAASGIDVVIDYLWGRPTELLLEALAKGFKASATQRTRLVEVGESAGKTITLPGATLRSIDLTLLGSGFGSASLDKILAAIPGLFSHGRDGKLKIAVEPVPLADVEAAGTGWKKGAGSCSRSRPVAPRQRSWLGVRKRIRSNLP